MKPTVAIVRGKFLNAYEMQIFEPLVDRYALTAFGSLTSYHDSFAFPVKKFLSPMDLPNIPYKMPILNRLCTDAHYLVGLEQAITGFDIVHTAESYFHYTQQCLAAKRQGKVKKVIATILENIPFNNEGIHGRTEFKKRSWEELDHCIALTEKTKQAMLFEGVSEKKITVIPHGINTRVFTPATDHVKERGRDEKHIRLLYSGRLEQYKGVFDVLYCYALLLRDPTLRGYHITLIMVGDGSQKSRLLELEERLGLSKTIIHKSAPYQEMPGIYHDADICILPSVPTPTYEEQYCTALLEAQASGLAIVTTACGGIPENIGTAGIIVPPGTPMAIAHEVRECIRSPKKRRYYAALARKRAMTVHDATIRADQLHALYAAQLGT